METPSTKQLPVHPVTEGNKNLTSVSGFVSFSRQKQWGFIHFGFTHLQSPHTNLVMGCHDVLVWTALVPHPRVSCCNYLFKIKYFPGKTSVEMWASCLTLINRTASKSHVWCIFSEGRTLSNPRRLRSVGVWTMSPLPSERAGSCHQLSNFYPLKQKHHEEDYRTNRSVTMGVG